MGRRYDPDAVRRHPLYPIWNGIMTRCHNPRDKDYPRYGGRGIYVVKPWHDFRTFAADMSPRPPGLQLERRRNGGPYSKANCYWTTASENSRNRRHNRRLTIDGKTLLVLEWSAISDVPYNTILARLDKWGFTPRHAVFKPLRHVGNRKSSLLI